MDLESGRMMTTLEEIQQAILNLSGAEYTQLKRWLVELEWERWDEEIEADSDGGKLDFLLEQAIASKKEHTHRDL